ncbi:hypothetical protein A4X13_0g62 [Tilletia indica]|uniref:Uncharacterized protein n=1 Tax=Tilletia indica TaxID=43049 RepID=A0A177TKB9_9BASI|nr:hypothetical protein A4X13_0g62 [Tilletia indica]
MTSAANYDAPPAQEADSALLTDVDVVTAFHSLLKDALAQARAEGLITDELLEQAGVDIQINGPALALCFAALQAAGSPPAIRAPDGSFVLDNGNCPPSFRVFFESWQREVIPIQHLTLENRHDLIRLICDKPALRPDLIEEQHPDIPRIAATLKSIAINLVQRRTFQLLFSDDLQHALDSNVRPSSPSGRSRSSGEFGSTNGSESGGRVVHQYQPPPGYEPPPPQAINTTTTAATTPAVTTTAPSPQTHQPPQPQFQSQPPLPEKGGRPLSPVPPRPPPSTTHPTSLQPPSLPSSPQPSSASLNDDPNLNLIRETLLSALADVLATTPTIRTLLSRNRGEWTSHAYFACLCLAILDVALHRVTPSGGVRCVQTGKGPGKIIGMADCPLQLRRLLWALSNIGAMCQRLAEDDDLAAMRLAEQSDSTPSAAAAANNGTDSQTTNRIERLRYRLENGVDRDSSTSSSSNRPSNSRTPGAGTVRLQTNVTEVSNNINRLALAFFKIPTFRERQREAFKVLQAVDSL